MIVVALHCIMGGDDGDQRNGVKTWGEGVCFFLVVGVDELGMGCLH